ncbi:MAG: thermonuclease family protein [Verrucomicrobia subdivision 3 bacterium]|nr:thermonuclease family protein [Limisphaerales bacterium]
MRSPAHSNSYILFRKGNQPDPAQALPYDKAAPLFLKGVASDPELKLFDTETRLTYTASDVDAVKVAYLTQVPPNALVIRSHDGASVTRIADLSAALDTLAQTKQGGLYVPKEDMWLIRPPEENPDHEQQVEDFKQAIADLGLAQPPETQSHAGMPMETYPVEARESSDIEILPGLSGDKVLEATIGYLQNANPVTLVVLGGLAGMVAYKSMGLKGVVGLVLATLALKRYLKMGHKVVLDQRLDLVARGIQDGIPVNKNGVIDPEFLDALRHFPAGDNRIAARQINAAVRARQWENNPIKIDPGSYKLQSFEETVSQVMDGDTLCGSRGRYRLIGVDTPDVDHNNSSHSHARAQKAWARLQKLIPPGSQVRVEVASNQPALYGRLPCYVYTKHEQGQEVCVNKLLIEEGLARVTNFQPYHPKLQAFVEASLSAIANRKGLWNAVHNPKPQPKLFFLESEKMPEPDGIQRLSLSLS